MIGVVLLDSDLSWFSIGSGKRSVKASNLSYNLRRRLENRHLSVALQHSYLRRKTENLSRYFGQKI
jgi:hypothetical protein